MMYFLITLDLHNDQKYDGSGSFSSFYVDSHYNTQFDGNDYTIHKGEKY